MRLMDNVPREYCGEIFFLFQIYDFLLYVKARNGTRYCQLIQTLLGFPLVRGNALISDTYNRMDLCQYLDNVYSRREIETLFRYL